MAAKKKVDHKPIPLPFFSNRFDALQADGQALESLKQWQSNFILQRESDLQHALNQFWHDVGAALQELDPVANPDDFDLVFDPKLKTAVRRLKP
jgi:hypothetical protein